MAMINVSDEIRALFDKHARAICEEAELKLDAFNQDANAMTMQLALEELDVDFSGADADKVLQLLKKGGNASANRQALTSSKKKAEGSAASASELLAKLRGA